MNLRVQAAAIALLAAASCSGEAAKTALAGAPTIVLVTIDAVPPSRLATYGGATAVPALDRLVAAGGVAMQGWTAVPMTRPAVASMFTGVGADRHGVLDDIQTPLAATPPVLAEILQKSGYKTAAFPGTPFLETASGVLRGFQTIDEPGPIPFGTPERVVVPLASDQVVAHALSWLKSIGPNDRAFVWLHFGETCTAVPGLFGGAEDGSDLDKRIEAADKALGQLLDGLVAASRLDGAEIIWAGTYGDVSEKGSGIAGPGFSPSESAVRVPLVYRAAPARKKSEPKGTIWGPDVAVTLAAAGGVELPGAEGADLSGGIPGDRTIFAWSTAPLEQLGWKPWAVAQKGGVRVDAASRAVLPRRLVPLEAVAPLLVKHGVKPEPLPATGHDCGPSDRCALIARETWNARWATANVSLSEAIPHFKAVRELDPLSLAGMLEWGINNSAEEIHPRGKALFEEAVKRYPGSPGALHWFGHSFDRQDPKDAEKIFAAIVAACPGQHEILYDIACMRALGGDVKGSLAALRQALQAGFRSWDWLQGDADLRAVRADPGFAALMREFGR